MEEEIINQRLKKLHILKEKGKNPFQERFFPAQKIEDILKDFSEGKKAKTAARLVALRTHGRVCFFDLEDITGKLQCYAREDGLGDDEFKNLLEVVDIGDFLGVEGTLFKTRSGQVTLDISSYKLLTKSLRPLPEKWHGLKDIEQRFRYRYLDLIANRKVREIFLKRTEILEFLRKFFRDRDYIEVETPILQALPGGARGKPFKTYHEALDCQFYLRIAPELYLKRLLVGGFRKVFEIGRNFRNEGLSTRHNPEFTMLEAYCAYQDYNYMMTLLEEMLTSLVEKILDSSKINYQGKSINLQRPWRKISFAEVLKEKFSIEYDDTAEEILARLKRKKPDISLSRSQMINIMEEIVEEEVGEDPVFIIDHPAIFSPLAKTKSSNPFIAERFELFVGGIEIANAYTELNDPSRQREMFEAQLKIDEYQTKIDEDFLRSLEIGMPPAAGLGIGVDRLTMLLVDTPSIKEVILFPLLRPQD